jgi:signal recognition particle subunit SRP54
MVLQVLGEKIKRIFSLKVDTSIEEKILKIKFALIESELDILLINEIIQYLKKHIESPSLIKFLLYQKLCSIFKNKKKIYKPLKKNITIVLLLGLQGSGKTTFATKYAYFYKKKNYRPSIICADTFRAGAFDQIKQNASKISIPFYGSHLEYNPIKLVEKGIKKLRKISNLIIIDTSGRHHQDDALINEFVQIKKTANPRKTICIVDGTHGNTVRSHIETFHKKIRITSIAITKTDGYGKHAGAINSALTLKIPIEFISYGEHFDQLKKYDSEEIISKLFGKNAFSSQKMFKKMKVGTSTLSDLYTQCKSFRQFSDMIPGLPIESVMNKNIVMMDSMSKREMNDPNPIKFLDQKTRIKRIALGSGNSCGDVENFLRSHKLYKNFSHKILNNSNLLKGINSNASADLFKNLNDGCGDLLKNLI